MQILHYAQRNMMKSDLRTRRRLRTAQTIRDAAVDLVLAEGLENVTTEMIAERAGISPRSFFNYFAFKEEALMPPPIEFAPQDIETYLNGTGPVMADMMVLLLTRFADVDPQRARIRQIYELAHRHPKLMLVRKQQFHQHEERIATLIAQRLGGAPGDRDAVLMAAVLAAAIRVAMSRWARDGRDCAQAEMRRTFDALQHLNTLTGAADGDAPTPLSQTYPRPR
jgi:AcrR family transcriptional regulator